MNRKNYEDMLDQKYINEIKVDLKMNNLNNSEPRRKHKKMTYEKQPSIITPSNGDKYFLLSDSLDCNLCIYDINNKFKLILKQKIHKMGIKSLIQISDTLYISFSIDKTISFWNLNIRQEIVEEHEVKEKKKKRRRLKDCKN